MFTIDWNKVSGNQFEEFVFFLLGKNGFKNRQWFGKGGGDKGRDLIAFKTEIFPFDIELQRKWVIQCKRWSKFPSKHIIDEEISSAKEHDPDFWLLVTSADPTPDQLDYINSFNNKCTFKLFVISRIHLEEILSKDMELKSYLEAICTRWAPDIEDQTFEISNKLSVYYRRDFLTLQEGPVTKHICEYFPSPPVISPNKRRMAYISPLEWEVLGEVFLFDFSNYENKVILHRDVIPFQFTPKELLWLDNRFLLMIIGFAYGTVTLGGDLYIFDTLNKRLLSYKKSNDKQEYKDIALYSGKVAINVITFDNNLNDHIEDPLVFTIEEINEFIQSELEKTVMEIEQAQEAQ